MEDSIHTPTVKPGEIVMPGRFDVMFSGCSSATATTTTGSESTRSRPGSDSSSSHGVAGSQQIRRSSIIRTGTDEDVVGGSSLSVHAAAFVPGQAWNKNAQYDAAQPQNTSEVPFQVSSGEFFSFLPHHMSALQESYVYPEFSLDVKIASFQDTVAMHRGLAKTKSFSSQNLESGERDSILRDILDSMSGNVRALMIVVKSWVKRRVDVFRPARFGGLNSISANFLVLIFLYRIVTDDRDNAPCLFSVKYFYRSQGKNPHLCTLRHLLALNQDRWKAVSASRDEFGPGPRRGTNFKFFHTETIHIKERLAAGAKQPDAFAVLDLFFAFLGFLTKEIVRGEQQFLRYRIEPLLHSGPSPVRGSPGDDETRVQQLAKALSNLPYRVHVEEAPLHFVHEVQKNYPQMFTSSMYLTDPDMYSAGTLALRDWVDVEVVEKGAERDVRKTYPGVVVGLRRRASGGWSQRTPMLDSVVQSLDKVEV